MLAKYVGAVVNVEFATCVSVSNLIPVYAVSLVSKIYKYLPNACKLL